ncbi:MAG TPA: hypothetical protein ENO00_09520 [Deltaproteobacteria bacterium]|nr:hypothetical protein [Deltaproteobacteria bacterium]
MALIIRIVEWLTKTMLMGMFHIWYLLGYWLSLYITIDEKNEDHPFSFSFDTENKWDTRKKEDKTISVHEEIL